MCSNCYLSVGVLLVIFFSFFSSIFCGGGRCPDCCAFGQPFEDCGGSGDNGCCFSEPQKGFCGGYQICDCAASPPTCNCGDSSDCCGRGCGTCDALCANKQPTPRPSTPPTHPPRPMPPTPIPNAMHNTQHKGKVGMEVGASVGAAVGFALLAAGGYLYHRRQKAQPTHFRQKLSELDGVDEVRQDAMEMVAASPKKQPASVPMHEKL